MISYEGLLVPPCGTVTFSLSMWARRASKGCGGGSVGGALGPQEKVLAWRLVINWLLARPAQCGLASSLLPVVLGPGHQRTGR